MENLQLNYLVDHFSVDQILNEINDDDIIAYCIDNIGVDDILSKFGDHILADHVSDFRFVADDENHAIEILRFDGLINNEWSETTISSKMRKPDCINLINQIIETKGWDYLYTLIEGEKIC